MSPHNHDAVPTYRTAHSPGYGAYADVENCSTTAGGRMHLTKLLHASGTLLPSFFRRFTLLSARHSNILHDWRTTTAPAPLLTRTRTPPRRRELPTALSTPPLPAPSEIAGWRTDGVAEESFDEGLVSSPIYVSNRDDDTAEAEPARI
ncbi:hypothetical protein JB92DRAFT_3114463 [Gautieria morchelliformis]|nr:hypothetical protein JB92DRAFT_3114463 [Gautieria morchelliformis]